MKNQKGDHLTLLSTSCYNCRRNPERVENEHRFTTSVNDHENIVPNSMGWRTVDFLRVVLCGVVLFDPLVVSVMGGMSTNSDGPTGQPSGCQPASRLGGVQLLSRREMIPPSTDRSTTHWAGESNLSRWMEAFPL